MAIGGPLKRRDLFVMGLQSGMVLSGAVLLARPGRALAMGGALPPVGEAAPDFDLPGVAPTARADQAADHSDNYRTLNLSLGDFRGRWLVLYFYPRDFTGGCTLEARGFQSDLGAFHTHNAEVVGISADDEDSHLSFCGSEGLVFPLLSDPGGEVSRRYGSWIAPFSQRHTFLIDPDGVLRARWTAVRPLAHSQEVLEELVQFQQPDTDPGRGASIG